MSILGHRPRWVAGEPLAVVSKAAGGEKELGRLRNGKRVLIYAAWTVYGCCLSKSPMAAQRGCSAIYGQPNCKCKLQL